MSGSASGSWRGRTAISATERLNEIERLLQRVLDDMGRVPDVVFGLVAIELSGADQALNDALTQVRSLREELDDGRPGHHAEDDRRTAAAH